MAENQGQQKEQRIQVEKVVNTWSSIAGANSSEFHRYNRMKHDERYRLAKMDREEKLEKQKDNFYERREAKELIAQSITDKKRDKRLKKRENKKKNKQQFKQDEQAKKINQFANDGSFLEQFKKMQNEKQDTVEDDNVDKQNGKDKQYKEGDIDEQQQNEIENKQENE